MRSLCVAGAVVCRLGYDGVLAWEQVMYLPLAMTVIVGSLHIRVGG